MQTKKATKAQEADLSRANELMRKYAQSEKNLRDLKATIANEVKAYEDNMKEAKNELIEIGERNRDLFIDDNLHFNDGYLHIANNSIIETTKKFNWPEFLEQKADLVKFEFERAKIKKAWLDIDQHNTLISLGVQVGTEQVMEVKIKKS